MEQTNENLRHEIIKYSKSIDDLKAQMQHMQEQHGKQIRNLQGIHNQELEAKDKEISRLNTILEKSVQLFSITQRDVENGKTMLCHRIHQRYGKQPFEQKGSYQMQ